MGERGFTLLEMVVVLGIIAVMLAVALPPVKAYSEEVHLLGAGQVFKGEFRRAYSMAIRSSAYTAIVFEPDDDPPTYSIYRDGNFNGVRRREIARGIDTLVEGPFRLSGKAPTVKVAIKPGTPKIPPARGTLDPSDPIRFGRSDILSFSPLGSATPGTFYLEGRHLQAAVRVTPGSARVRLMIYRGAWRER